MDASQALHTVVKLAPKGVSALVDSLAKTKQERATLAELYEDKGAATAACDLELVQYPNLADYYGLSGTPFFVISGDGLPALKALGSSGIDAVKAEEKNLG